MNFRKVTFGATTLMFFATMALAHGEATETAIHGGVMVQAEMYHAEIRVSQGEIAVWLVDHTGEQIAVDGWSGQAVLLQGSDRIDLELSPGTTVNVPDGEEEVPALVGQDDAVRGDTGDRVTITLTDPDASSEEVRVTVGESMSHH